MNIFQQVCAAVCGAGVRARLGAPRAKRAKAGQVAGYPLPLRRQTIFSASAVAAESPVDFAVSADLDVRLGATGR